MKKSIFFFLISAVTITLSAQPGLARTGYVSDMLLLTFRQGPGNSYAVEKTLPSNTPVIILEEKNNFFKVELKSGETGWVDKKFIVFEPPKIFIIDQLKKENKKLKNKISDLEAIVQSLKQEISTGKSAYSSQTASLEASLQTALEEKEKLADSLSMAQNQYKTLIEQSRNIQQIIKENKTLKKNNSALLNELETLKDQNKNLFKTSMIKWFLSGVGVLLTGWIIGRSVSFRKRRSSSLLS